jgi:beta-xylosidase
VRVGGDYWMTASSFGHVPGLPILHSRDLVNWRLVNHALPRLGPDFDRPQHGNGVWAPSLRHHGGWYWIFAPAGGVATGWQLATRSRSPLGPYEHRVVLAQGRTAVNGPHQGAGSTRPRANTGSSTSRTAAPTAASCTSSRCAGAPTAGQ